MLLTLLWWTTPALAEGFRCAGSPTAENALAPGAAAKPARTTATTTGTRRALVLFARFQGEPANPVPSWAVDIFNPNLPGSFAHFYDTMSFGKLQVRGEAAPRVYESAQPASAYLSEASSEQGRFGEFTREILRQADRDIDFAQFDNDGPDGVPNSGDDDGVVDAVFVVLERVPVGLLLGEATGISNLGFDDPQATADPGAKGQVIQIHPGTIQQGRFFAEAVGSICHEYGHILGLPDLYDTEFFRVPGAGPEKDSAGVGAWCLMGWGATGWNGNDGPNSFCAWSRMQLGWAQVEEIYQARQEARLGEVGQTGAVYKIPVDVREYFLLEYRTRVGSFYDRHLPGEGLLIWHTTAQGAVDLECADGQWQEAGYPQGQIADPQAGGDNLDFWAHDQTYTARHRGNLGDGTDPFDGARFRDFTARTNPASYSVDGTRSVRIEGIHFESGQVVAQIQTDPARLEIGEVKLKDPDGNGVLSPGELGTLQFWLTNQGGLTAPEVRTVLSTADSALHIEQAETRFGAVEILPRAERLSGEGFPQVSLKGDPKINRQARMVLEVYSGETQLAQHEFTLPVASTFRWSGRVVDEEGQGLEGLKIQIQGNKMYTVTTGVDGVFEIDLIPGIYSASISTVIPDIYSYFEIAYTFGLYADLYTEFVQPTTYPVSGTVRDAQGLPIQANLNASTSAWGASMRYYRGYDYSAADGAYLLMLPKGTYQFTIPSTSPEMAYYSLSNVHVDGPMTLDITLKQGVRFSAQTVNEKGEGVPSFLGMVRLPYQRGGGGNTLQVDAGGSREASVLPGMYLVQVARPYLLDSPFLSVGAVIPVFADTSVRFTLGKGFAVTGRVEVEFAEPFFRKYLILIPQAPYGQVWIDFDDDGTYEAQVPPGTSQVVFVGNDPVGRRLRHWLGELSTQSGGTFDWQVPASERVAGRVVDENGQGIAGIEVQALSVGAGVSNAVTTRAAGVFDAELVPGTYELTGVEGSASFFSLGTLEAPFADTLELRKPGGVLQGKVVDGQGHPIEQALVLLTRDARLLTNAYLPYLSAPQVYQSGGLVAAAISGEGGIYQLHAQAGAYAVIVFPEINAGVGRVIGKMAIEVSRTQDLLLPTPERVHLVYGQIKEEPGQPGGELIMQFYGSETEVVVQVTDQGYRGYGAELPPGRYQVRAGRLGPVGGFQQVYEVGSVSIDRDLRWDIDLAGAPTSVAEQAAFPASFSLAPNYPNPFNPSTTLRFSLPQAGEAELSIYNLLGQRVATLVHGVQEAGPHVLQWNGRDDQGRELASGVYLCRLKAGTQVETRKLLLLR